MNISTLLAEQAARRPDATALLFQGKAVSYAQLDDAAGRAAAAFKASGVQPGDRVALVVGNVPEFVYALYGVWRAGAVAVPLNVMLTSEELGYILADAGARAIVTQMQHLPEHPRRPRPPRRPRLDLRRSPARRPQRDRELRGRHGPGAAHWPRPTTRPTAWP